MAPTAVVSAVRVVEDRPELAEGGKMKKTRRGKKRRSQPAAAAPCWQKTSSCGCGAPTSSRGVFQPIENIATDVNSDPCNNLNKGGAGVEPVKQKVGQRSLRPIGMFAPENSTQFLIADHGEATHSLLEDLVSPKRSRCQDGLDADNPSPKARSSLRSSPAYSDIEFVYESPDDINMDQFLKDEFEKTLLDAHQEELMSCSREELVQRVISLEERGETLEKQVQVAAPMADCSLEDLVKELEDLKQQNMILKAENTSLRIPSWLCHLLWTEDNSNPRFVRRVAASWHLIVLV